ncbi:MAG: ATP-binding cassette domain-containing protein [Bacteroidales bacterium]|nr:ATP-binding cassette domain-containing protein [Bacteroidales bacterium]MBN2758233.1 ATP-binding cassette domain-containing protein [Bacteroidales bacterium]
MYFDLSIKKTLHTVDGIIDLDVEISANKGEIITLFGKSGAGKTTLLRIIAGLTEPENGKIVIDSKVWYNSDEKTNLNAQKRKTGFVFQDYALFPNMSVQENLLFANKDEKDVAELLKLTNLKNLENRKPDTLSGGQKQRVALARALVTKPDLLLLDEPLASLDHEMRQELQDEIIKINNKYGVTIILVSHDLAEIFKLSKKVYIIDKGVVVNSGSPEHVFTHESFSAKFQFIGEILKIKKADSIYIVDVLVGNNIIKVVATEKEAGQLKIAEKIIVGSKAFNPVIKKLPIEQYGNRIKNIWFEKKDS